MAEFHLSWKGNSFDKTIFFNKMSMAFFYQVSLIPAS